MLSFGTAGCNLACKFCQNWDISKSRDMDRLMDLAGPAQIAAAAEAAGSKSVAFTYNDPVIFAEYAMDVADACHDRGIRTVEWRLGLPPGHTLPWSHWSRPHGPDERVQRRVLFRPEHGTETPRVVETNRHTGSRHEIQMVKRAKRRKPKVRRMRDRMQQTRSAPAPGFPAMRRAHRCPA